MPDKFVPIIDLLKDVPMIDDAGKKSPRNKSAFLRLLRTRFKLSIKFVTFPGRFQGRAVAAITEEEAKPVRKALTRQFVVSEDSPKKEKA